MNIGDRLLNYEILALLGKGGFGDVFLARDVNLDVNVAIKVMRAEISNSATMLHRLKVGARAAARLKHPNIQTVHYLGRDPASQQDFVVMEYLSGGTLRQRIALGALPIDEALSIFTTTCSAVDFAHRHGVIHRDLKPDNVMFDADGKLVVTDFDLARVTGEARHTVAGQMMGSLLYISPEQARGDDITPATDIYSLGVILFELMTGRWPFMSANPMEVLRGHLQQPPPLASELNPALPAHVDRAIERALAKSPTDRFETAWQLACAAINQTYTPQGKPPAKPISDSDFNVVTPPLKTIFVLPPGRVRVLNGPLAGQQFSLGNGVSIGYGKKKNDIHLADDYVSRAHARLDRSETGYALMDLRSTNGTKLNGKPVEPYTATPLNAGDQIEIGETRLIFETE